MEDIATTDIQIQEDFSEMPYNAILNILLYCPGIRTVASLQGTCKRIYEIGSEEDYIWRLQMERFYPELKPKVNSYFFVGYYYLLRSHVSAKKLQTLTRLVNQSASSEGKSLVAEDRRTMLNANELSFRFGVALGPSAGTLLSNIYADSTLLLGEVHNQKRRSPFLLDTIDLSGMLLRAEGLEQLAKIAQLGGFPFLRTLALRQNKLGTGNDCQRSGNALRTIMNTCRNVETLDLSENSIAGVDGLKKMFCCSSSSESKTATSSSNNNICVRIPKKLWLNQNYLGTEGVCFFLEELATKQMQTSSCSCPSILSLQSVGIGYEHKSVNAAKDASRSSITKCVELFKTSVNNYTQIFHQVGDEAAIGRRKQKMRSKSYQRQKQQQQQQQQENMMSEEKSFVNLLGKEQDFVDCVLLLDQQGQQNENNNNSAATTSSSALKNSLPPSFLKVLKEKSPEIESKYFGQNKNSSSSIVLKSTGSRLKITMPTFDGEEPSGCLIC